MSDLIERELDLPAAPAEVWRAITDPEWLSGWLADQVQLDLTPGGDARFVIGEEVRDGWVEEVIAPAAGAGRLTFWWSCGDEPASRVELVVSAVSDDVTRLHVSETRPLEVLDLIGIPFGGAGRRHYGPALVAA